MSGFGARNIQMDRRGERVFEAIVESGSLVVRQFGGDRAGEVGAHRFFEAPDVSFETIGDRFAARTRHAAQGRRIVVAQDTTEINFSGRDRGRKGLGPAGNGKALGFFVHPLIAVDIDTEALLGLCWSKIWTRSDTGLRHRRARDFADKESYRWLQATSAAGVLLDAAAAVVMVADREGDIYPHFARRPDRVDVIIRAAQDRNLAAGGHLFAALEALPALGGQRVDIRPRRIGRKGRTARVVLKAGQVRIRRPQHGCWRDDPDYLELNVVEAREIDAPEGAAPLLWRLVTTLPVTTLAEACEVVRLYRLRWRIEEVFSGAQERWPETGGKPDGVRRKAVQTRRHGAWDGGTHHPAPRRQGWLRAPGHRCHRRGPDRACRHDRQNPGRQDPTSEKPP